jgi:hypothetical protein
MKISGIVCLVFLHCSAASFMPFDNAATIFKQFTRMKRDAIPVEMPCMLKCLESVRKDIEHEVRQLEKSSKADEFSFENVVCQWHDPKMLAVTCKPYRKYTQCLSKCPRGEWKDFAFKLLEPAKFMCADRYSDFKENLQCIYGSCQQAKRTCESKCQKYEEKLEPIPKLVQERPVPDAYMDTIVSPICAYTDCITDCWYPVIGIECGQGALNLERELLQITIDAVKIAAETLVGGQNLHWPESCQMLAENAGYPKRRLE